MEREVAVAKLSALLLQDLRPLADKLVVTVWKGEKINKGWAGHTLERILELPLNSSRAPNFGSWELKLVPLKRNSLGEWVAKETMAITMIDAVDVANKPFLESHVYSKLKKAVVCARSFISKKEESSILLRVATFDLSDAKLLADLEADYELVRQAIKNQGFNSLTGKMGKLIQPRTKGAGHVSTSRAFYARTGFVNSILGLPAKWEG